jgi:hypothetical protein
MREFLNISLSFILISGDGLEKQDNLIASAAPKLSLGETAVHC